MQDPRAQRPQAAIPTERLPFEGCSTYKDTFGPKEAPYALVRPKNAFELNTAPFDGERPRVRARAPCARSHVGHGCLEWEWGAAVLPYFASTAQRLLVGGAALRLQLALVSELDEGAVGASEGLVRVRALLTPPPLPSSCSGTTSHKTAYIPYAVPVSGR